jgi:hypothetical protein
MTTQNDIGAVFRPALQLRYEDAHLEINLEDKTAFVSR